MIFVKIKNLIFIKIKFIRQQYYQLTQIKTILRYFKKIYRLFG